MDKIKNILYNIIILGISFILVCSLYIRNENQYNEYVLNCRIEQNMIEIDNGYVYEAESHVVFEEIITGKSLFHAPKVQYKPCYSKGKLLIYENGAIIEKEGD